MSRSKFGGYSRARDGCIVTFRMPDDSIEVHHFSTIISVDGCEDCRRFNLEVVA